MSITALWIFNYGMGKTSIIGTCFRNLSNWRSRIVAYMSLVGWVIVADYLPTNLTELSTESPITPNRLGWRSCFYFIVRLPLWPIGFIQSHPTLQILHVHNFIFFINDPDFVASVQLSINNYILSTLVEMRNSGSFILFVVDDDTSLNSSFIPSWTDSMTLLSFSPMVALVSSDIFCNRSC